MDNNKIYNFKKIFAILKKSYNTHESPSVTLIANVEKKAYNILISTIISLRTKDQVTLESSKRLFTMANSINELKKLSAQKIAKLIYPAGFYNNKSKQIKNIAEIISSKYNGVVPDNIDDLLDLPGVGRKTANLVLSLAYKKDTICVDTHVHRISNRIGWVKTKTPEQTEFALMDLIPVKFWRDINEYLVSYGQVICKPVSPLCSKCELNNICRKVNVLKSR